MMLQGVLDPISGDELVDYASRVVAKLKTDLESHSIWLRKSSGVDLVIGGHLRRATIAMESTLLLARTGAGYDAAVTARVVLEHSLSAASIAFADDPEQEAYFFITRQWRHIRDANRKLREHYPELAQPNEEVQARVQELIAQTDESWAGERLHKIVSKLDAKVSSDTRLFSWLFDVPYDALSNYVHARALGLRTIVPALGEPFTFDLLSDQRFAVNVVRQGMVGYLAMMIAVEQAWDSGGALKAIILDPLEDFVRRAGLGGEMGVYEID